MKTKKFWLEPGVGRRVNNYFNKFNLYYLIIIVSFHWLILIPKRGSFDPNIKRETFNQSKYLRTCYVTISLLLYVKKYLNNFFATISVKKSQNPNFRNLEKFFAKQKNTFLFIVDKEPEKIISFKSATSTVNLIWNDPYNLTFLLSSLFFSLNNSHYSLGSRAHTHVFFSHL